MSLKKPSFDAIAKAINETRLQSDALQHVTACHMIATRIADYFAGQNQEFDVVGFLKASGAWNPEKTVVHENDSQEQIAATQQDPTDNQKLIGDK